MKKEENKVMKMLRKKNRQRLDLEFGQLQERQKELRELRETLEEKRDGLYQMRYAAMKAGDDATDKVLVQQISDIGDRIKEVKSEHKSNGEVLELYSKVIKNKKDANSTLLSVLFGGLGTGAVIWLGKESLERAYNSDLEGTLINKKALDVFNKLNPMKLISLIHKL